MTTITDETKYIYPPRPEICTPREDNEIYKTLDWTAQYKYNDTRVLIKLRSTGRIEIWNRHAERIKYNPPTWLTDQLHTIHEKLGPGYHLLDGGLLDQKHRAIKNTIIIWDILIHNNQHLTGTTYNTRYNIIHNLTNTSPATGTPKNWDYTETLTNPQTTTTLGHSITENIHIPQNWEPNKWTKCWETIDKLNAPHLKDGCGPLIEGLVYKDPNGILTWGFKPKNNSNWIARSRVTTGRHKF